MSITIKKGRPYPLQIPEFVVDRPLKDGVPEPYSMLTSGFRFISIIARPGAGKTSLLISMFKDKRLLKKTWENIILVMPKQSLLSLKQKDNVFKKLPLEKYYENLDDIQGISDQIHHYAEEKESTCLIIDDMASYLKQNEVQKILGHLVMNRRHLRLSVILLTQIYNKMPLAIRKLINIAVILYKPSKKEMTDLIEELLEYPEEISDKVFHHSFQKQYDQLWIDVPNQTLYRNADQIIIHLDKDETEPATDR